MKFLVFTLELFSSCQYAAKIIKNCSLVESLFSQLEIVWSVRCGAEFLLNSISDIPMHTLHGFSAVAIFQV